VGGFTTDAKALSEMATVCGLVRRYVHPDSCPPPPDLPSRPAVSGLCFLQGLWTSLSRLKNGIADLWLIPPSNIS